MQGLDTGRAGAAQEAAEGEAEKACCCCCRLAGDCAACI